MHDSKAHYLNPARQCRGRPATRVVGSNRARRQFANPDSVGRVQTQMPENRLNDARVCRRHGETKQFVGRHPSAFVRRCRPRFAALPATEHRRQADDAVVVLAGYGCEDFQRRSVDVAFLKQLAAGGLRGCLVSVLLAPRKLPEPASVELARTARDEPQSVAQDQREGDGYDRFIHIDYPCGAGAR